MAGALLANATNALSINNKTSNLCLSNSLGLRNPGSFTCSSLRNLLGFSFEKEKGIIFKKFVTTASMAESVIPGVIIGAGRIGQALYNMSDKRDVIVTRGETIPQDCPGPIFVCTRNDALEGVVNATPVHRRKDLVFLQNGMIEPWLESKGLSSNTQLLVYFAVAKIGDAPIDGKTDVNPEGLTAVTGEWSKVVAERLRHGGLACKELDSENFKKSMLEKLIWISAFMLVGASHPGASVGEVESTHREEVVKLIEELTRAAEIYKNVSFDNGVVERLLAYARSVSNYPTAVKEFEWRNGWFYSLSKKSLENGRPDLTPFHTELLKKVGAI